MSATLYTKTGADGDFAVQPPSSCKLVLNFVYTNPAVARPSVPSYCSINWIGPPGSGPSAPTNMASSDTWDAQT